MVLHDINQAITYSDAVIGLKDGVVSMQGEPQDAITAESIEALYGIRLDVVEGDGRKVDLTA